VIEKARRDCGPVAAAAGAALGPLQSPMTETAPVKLRSPLIFFGYAAFLAAAGIGAWAASGFADSARTAVISGVGSGTLILVCGIFASLYNRKRALASVGIHVGMLLALAFSCVFLWRAFEAYSGYKAGRPPLAALVTAHNALADDRAQISTKQLYLPMLLGSMSLVSAGVLGALIASRPKPAKAADPA